jgi:hypothetical protein
LKKINNSPRTVSCYLMLRILSNEFQKTKIDKENWVPNIKWLWSSNGKCLSSAYIALMWKCVYESKNNDIVSNKIFYLTINNIVDHIDYFCFIFLCIKITMYQCVIFYHALCYVIIINLMVHMLCVSRDGKIFKITWTRCCSTFWVVSNSIVTI